MAFCSKGITFLLLALAVVSIQPLNGLPFHARSLSRQQDDTLNIARGIANPTTSTVASKKATVSSTFTFLSQSELAKGLDYLKKTYPNVDWSLVSTSVTGKREFKERHGQSKRNVSSTFAFLTQAEIDKGLDYLKKKYPNVDWSLVSLSGKREFKERHGQSKRNVNSTFAFLTQAEIDNGLDYLKKKYPNVDWSLFTSSIGKRGTSHGIIDTIQLRARKRESNSINKKIIQVKKNLDTSWTTTVQQRNDILDTKREPTPHDDLTSTFEFLEPKEEEKGLDYLKENYPDVDWSLVTSPTQEDETLGA